MIYTKRESRPGLMLSSFLIRPYEADVFLIFSNMHKFMLYAVGHFSLFYYNQLISEML